MSTYNTFYEQHEAVYGDAVESAVQIIDLYPELVLNKLLVKKLDGNSNLSNMQLSQEGRDQLHRIQCKDELIQEICEVIVGDVQHNNKIRTLTKGAPDVDFPALYRYMFKPSEVYPEDYE
jgi:hypothetical protein